MVSNLEPNQVILKEKKLLHLDENQEEVDFDSYEIIEFNEDCLTVMNTGIFFSKKDDAIREDFDLTADRNEKFEKWTRKYLYQKELS
jgi:hypothetical protein